MIPVTDPYQLSMDRSESARCKAQSALDTGIRCFAERIVSHRPIHQQAPRWSPKSPLRYKRRGRRVWRAAHFVSFTEMTLSCTKAKAQLAVIFGQRRVDKVRATITVDAQHTPTDTKKSRNPAPAVRLALTSTSQMARPSLFTAVVFLLARWKASCPHWVSYVQRQLFDPPKPIATCIEAPQSPLDARCGPPGDTHLRRQSRVYFGAGPLRRHQAVDRSPWSRFTNAQGSLSSWTRASGRLTGSSTSCRLHVASRVGLAGSPFVEDRPTLRRIPTKN